MTDPASCAHVETFPIGWGIVRCLACGVALTVDERPPHLRQVIREASSASWNELEDALRGTEQPRPRPWWESWFRDWGHRPPPAPLDRD